MTRRIGILGGTFDPIHCGHLDVASAAEAALGLTRLFVIPSSTPPHRQQAYASSFHRFAMVALAVSGRQGWLASDLELRVDGSSPSYTATTLQRFEERGYEPSELFFIIGADAFADIGAWMDYPRLLDRANFAVVSRPGWPAEDFPQRMPHLAARMTRAPFEETPKAGTLIFLIDARTPDVSSTAIRQRRIEGDSIAGMVDPRVQQHIEQHGLYASNVPGRRRSDSPQDPPAGRLHG